MASSGSLKRFDTNKAIFVSRLLKAWEKLPDLAFGEMLGKAFESSLLDPSRLRGLSNDELIMVVERLALMYDDGTGPRSGR
jgi:hypothetical protein